MKFDWQHRGGNWIAEMPDNVTLVVSPDALQGFSNNPKRGTFWRAQASHWTPNANGVGGTMSRFGRDEYNITHKKRIDAIKAAEKIYLDAVLTT